LKKEGLGPRDEVDAFFRGEKENEYSGQSVDGAGDLNGDGYDDFLIGSPFHDVGVRTETGKSYVVFGKGTNYSDNIELSGGVFLPFIDNGLGVAVVVAAVDVEVGPQVWPGRQQLPHPGTAHWTVEAVSS